MQRVLGFAETFDTDELISLQQKSGWAELLDEWLAAICVGGVVTLLPFASWELSQQDQNASSRDLSFFVRRHLYSASLPERRTTLRRSTQTRKNCLQHPRIWSRFLLYRQACPRTVHGLPRRTRTRSLRKGQERRRGPAAPGSIEAKGLEPLSRCLCLRARPCGIAHGESTLGVKRVSRSGRQIAERFRTKVTTVIRILEIMMMPG